MVHLDLPSFPTRRSSDLVGSAMDIESVPGGVGPALRRHRVRAGLSQEGLARQAGLSLRAIRDIERGRVRRSEEHTSELQSLRHLVCRLLLEKKNTINRYA